MMKVCYSKDLFCRYLFEFLKLEVKPCLQKVMSFNGKCSSGTNVHVTNESCQQTEEMSIINRHNMNKSTDPVVQKSYFNNHWHHHEILRKSLHCCMNEKFAHLEVAVAGFIWKQMLNTS
ncbi:hypothetical protein HELRODRAFT_160317 [Helobdella robusta]|uniref:Uncharacterized protein n=1 Tax=Helobdella robusta TaxID=6412 RepID=T1EQ31_HELRO|nr:hypothetical protein HELRODRAFT_160317 [Helobdella robusta]ESO06165.1 hypothetical protein HELRODRAFT_160317 [Helobdella robusta]